MPPELPVDHALPQVLAAVREHGAAVLTAPTGTGKTTRVPPALLDAGLAGDGAVVMLEPRRLAARAAARRIASERGSRLGGDVGYRVRFDDRSSARTRILVVTDGVFLRMLERDAFLPGVGVVVFDEFHERSLDADVAVAMVQRVRGTVREDLRVVAMSATLDPAPIAEFLGAPVIAAEGRAHAVEIVHSPRPRNVPLERAVRSAVLDVLQRNDGDVLVFLPGVGEIRRAAGELADSVPTGITVHELYGDLPAEKQDAAIEPGPLRKVVLATNVAETSLTIPGIRAVVDTGLERLPRLDPGAGLERLELVRISRESAEQRAGRAGRTAPGVCVRLWGKGEGTLMPARRPPEIQRVDLAGTVLRLRAWGEEDLHAFPWFEPPEAGALRSGNELLQRLGAVGPTGVSDLGRAMAALPVHPRIARMLLAAHELGHARRIALAAAVIAERSPFERAAPGARPRHHSESDVLDAVEALEEFERSGRPDAGTRRLRRGAARFVLSARDQLARLVDGPRTDVDRDEAVLRAVFAGYADRLAKRREPGSDRGVMVGGRGIKLHASAAVRDSELFVGVDVDAGQADAIVRSASAVDPAWLPADRLARADDVHFDGERHAVVGVRRSTYEDLVLDEVPLQVPRGAEVERLLVAAAAQDLRGALALDDPPVAEFLGRVRSLAEWRPELGLPTFDDDTLRALLPQLAAGRRSFDELRRARLLDALRAAVGWEKLAVLDRDAPERVEVPSGNRIRLRYEPGRPPVLAVQIQEMFGATASPRVAAGRVPVLLHLLGPNRRAEQITDDLSSFWANTYPRVRAELRRRYPKHAWPEDPLSAKPERRPRRRR